MVLVNEKTKIDVSLGAFNSGSIFTPQSNSLMANQLVGSKHGPTSQQHI